MDQLPFLTREDLAYLDDIKTKNPRLSHETIMNIKYLRSLKNRIKRAYNTKKYLAKALETYVLARSVIDALAELETKYVRLSTLNPTRKFRNQKGE